MLQMQTSSQGMESEGLRRLCGSAHARLEGQAAAQRVAEMIVKTPSNILLLHMPGTIRKPSCWGEKTASNCLRQSLEHELLDSDGKIVFLRNRMC